MTLELPDARWRKAHPPRKLVTRHSQRFSDGPHPTAKGNGTNLPAESAQTRIEDLARFRSTVLHTSENLSRWIREFLLNSSEMIRRHCSIFETEQHGVLVSRELSRNRRMQMEDDPRRHLVVQLQQPDQVAAEIPQLVRARSIEVAFVTRRVDDVLVLGHLHLGQAQR